MLIGNVLEKTDAEAAWQVSASKLADAVRTSWQEHTNAGDKQWEETFFEDPLAIIGLREEGFKGLVGLDYIFKWWGAEDSEALAGAVEVLWKTIRDEDQDGDVEGINCYRTWVKLAERDFILGLYKEEGAKREKNREAFREAFKIWKGLFAEL